MNKTIKLWIYILPLIATNISSCDHEEIPVYEDVDRIYFRYADETSSPENEDNTTINMGYDIPLKDDSTISVPIKLMGRISNIDRTVNVELMKDESTAIEGEDIEIISANLPANSIYGEVKMKIYRTTNIDAETRLARIRLISNENFHTDYSTVSSNSGKNGLIYNVYFTANADKPSLWTASMSSMMLEAYFGEYSNEKIVVMCEACGFTRDFFNIDPEDNDPSGRTTLDKRIPSEAVWGIIIQVNNYLDKWKADHNGQPRLDENGEEVTMKYDYR